MNYTELTEEEQKQILSQRTKQYEADHFNHSINKELLLASIPPGQTPDEATQKAVDAEDAAMKTLDDAHKATKAKIDKIGKGKPK